jgi:hypothetical protein
VVNEEPAERSHETLDYEKPIDQATIDVKEDRCRLRSALIRSIVALVVSIGVWFFSDDLAGEDTKDYPAAFGNLQAGISALLLLVLLWPITFLLIVSALSRALPLFRGRYLKFGRMGRRWTCLICALLSGFLLFSGVMKVKYKPPGGSHTHSIWP